MFGFRFYAKWIGSMVVVFILAACGSGTPSTPTPTPGVEGIFIYDPPGQINDFTLTDQYNKPQGLADLKGKLALITFGYTHCTDVCPITLARFRQIKGDLDKNADQVNFVFVSVDGRRDTPGRLLDYLRQFDPVFIGLTGNEDTVRVMAKDYGATFYTENGVPTTEDYDVTHTDASFLMDREGRLLRKYSYDLEHNVIAADINQILQG